MLSITLKKKLRDFSIDIEAEIGAEIVVLIGNSGCGKTTTLHMLSGLLAPDDGNITLSDKTFYDKDKYIYLDPEERNIGYVFQHYALFPHLTVKENIAYGITNLPQKEKEKRIEETITFLRLGHVLHSKPATLSGGEQQRVALGRALVTKPKLLLLDEPLSALDVSNRTHVRMELKKILKQLGIPVILVTHDYEDARILADRVAVMAEGKVMQTGTPEELRKYPFNRFVAQFTNTNLIPIRQGSDHPNKMYAAFDSWKVDVSKKTASMEHQWQGEIEDVMFQGGNVRVRIAAEENIIADIPMEKWEDESFDLGDRVYVSVQKEDARPIVVNEKERTYKEEVSSSSTTKKGGWKKKLLLVSILFVLLAAETWMGRGIHSLASENETELLALVAANATDPFQELITTFENRHPGVTVEASFAGTQRNRTQLEQGTRADLFLSADERHMQAVYEQDIVPEFFTVSYNEVVIIVPKDKKIEIESLEDLANEEVKLVIGTESVPIGEYSRVIFNKAGKEYGNGFTEDVLENVVSLETNVKQVLQKVSLKEADAGMVYATDVTPAFKETVNVIEIPEPFQVTAANFIAVPVDAANPELAEEFVELMLSPEGQDIFQKYNYQPVANVLSK